MSITHNGKTLTLTSDADYTNRLLPAGYTNYNDAQDGEQYDFEMSAHAIDSAGNPYRVYWLYTNIKGETGNDLDWYDYDGKDISRVEPL